METQDQSRVCTLEGYQNSTFAQYERGREDLFDNHLVRFAWFHAIARWCFMRGSLAFAYKF